jgi:sulfite reductase alpha subunit-like flavoprotein
VVFFTAKLSIVTPILQGESEYEEWKYHKNKNIVEVIEDFSSLTIPAALLLAQLPRLQPVRV